MRYILVSTKIATVYLFCALQSLIVYAQTDNLISKINHHISTKQCANAIELAQAGLVGAIRDTVFGFIYLDCFSQKEVAIKYFRMAAALGDPIATSKLQEFGINQIIVQVDRGAPRNSEYIRAESNPPPYISIPPPVIKKGAPVIIIPGSSTINNPNSCIQDGGGVYCPNHPNSRLIPFKY